MKKIIRGWAVLTFSGSFMFNTVAETREGTMRRFTDEPVSKNWRTFYKLGYRIRRITITWED